MKDKNIIIVLAGGVGKRMHASLPKQFIKLGEKPIIVHTLTRIVETKLFDTIYVVIHPEWIDYLKDILSDNGLDLHLFRFVFGGKERIDSLENALDTLKEHKVHDNDIILVHDAVRPFITADILKRSLQETDKYGASIATLPVKDTPVSIQTDGSMDLVDRKTFFFTQTPAGFRFSVIYHAVKQIPQEDKYTMTGVVQICQKQGIPIHPFLGDECNIKITTPLDLVLGQIILNGQSRKE